ncbi:hypothetical protein F4810DRAFT_724488 [Camillea tinctor]|nr:hypothetical protein F4810DRAFT_724488 [Camillea tinctor]
MASYTPLSLPYFAPSEELPAPLPSFEEIVSTKHKYLSLEYGRRVVLIDGGHYVAKWGSEISVQEAENALFIQRNCPQARVPKVYAVYQRQHLDTLEIRCTDYESEHREDGMQAHEEDAFLTPTTPQLITVVVMEYIPGQNLESIIHRLSPHDRNAITTTLAAQFTALRRVPQEQTPGLPPYFGSVGRRPYEGAPFWRGHSGPFTDASAYLAAVLDIGCGAARRDARWTGDMEESYCALRDGLRGCVQAADDGYATPVFTHASIHPGDIIVERKEGGEWAACVVDLSGAGWHPAFWQCVSMDSGCRYDSEFWREVYQRMVPFYAQEEKLVLQSLALGKQDYLLDVEDED